MCKYFIACTYGYCIVGDGSPVPPNRLYRYVSKRSFDNYFAHSFLAFLSEEGGPQRGGRSLLKALLQSRLRRASFLWEEALKREREHRRGRVSRPDPPALSMCKVRFTLFQPSSPREVAFSQENDGRSVLRKAPSVTSRQLTLFSAKPARLVPQPDAIKINFPEILSKALYNGAKMC